MGKKVNDRLKKLLALFMSAVLLAGMMPQDMTGVHAEEEKEAGIDVPAEEESCTETAGEAERRLISISADNVLPKSISADMAVPEIDPDFYVHGNEDDADYVKVYFEGFYNDLYEFMDVDYYEEEKTAFVNNRYYYAVFDVKANIVNPAYDQDCECEYYIRDTDIDVQIDGVPLKRIWVQDGLNEESYNACRLLFYIRYAVGEPGKCTLTFDPGAPGNKYLEGKKVSLSYEYSEGETVNWILSKKNYNIEDPEEKLVSIGTNPLRDFDDEEIEYEGDTYLFTGWTVGEKEIDGFGYIPAGNTTISAKWEKMKAATSAEFTLSQPKIGDGLYSFGCATAEQLSCYGSEDFYTDQELKNKINWNDAEDNKVYYCKIKVDGNDLWYIDENALPQVKVNGQIVTLKRDMKDTGWGPWYFVFKVTPTASTYTLSLDYGSFKICGTKSITGIPSGTDPDIGDFSLINALFYDLKNAGTEEMTYEKYLEYEAEYKKGSAAFNAKYKKADLTTMDEHVRYTQEIGRERYTLGRYKSRPDYYDDLDNIYAALHSDRKLYLMCEEELDIIYVKTNPLICGSRAYWHVDDVDEETGALPVEGINGTALVRECICNKDKQPSMAWGDREYLIQIERNYIEIDQETHFGYYLGEKPTLKVWRGKTEIDEDGDEVKIYDTYEAETVTDEYGTEVYYYIPVTAVHDIGEKSEQGKKNVVPAGCEKEGSYDAVMKGKCKVCGEEVEELVHKTIPAGHDWGEWKVTKEATETEEGVEERVCKNDPNHKETKKIPVKKTEVEEPAKEPEAPKPVTETPAETVPVKETAKINDADVAVETVITYPKAVEYSGSKVTKEQLAALSKDGVIAAVNVTGIEQALPTLSAGTDVSKLFDISYSISKEKNAGKQGSFTVKLKLNKKALKAAGIKSKKDKAALNAIIKQLNEQFKANPYKYDIVPLDLTKVEDVTIRATFKNGALQLNEDGSIKKIKNVKVKTKVSGSGKEKTITVSAKNVAKNFSFANVDAANNKADITALESGEYTGTRTGVSIVK